MSPPAVHHDSSLDAGITSHWAAQELRALSITSPDPEEPSPHPALLIRAGAGAYEEIRLDEPTAIEPTVGSPHDVTVLPEMTLQREGEEMTMTFSDFSIMNRVLGTSPTNRNGSS